MAALYTDQNVHLNLAPILGQRGHDVVTTRDLGQEGATDDAQLLTAALRGSILPTHDIADYQLLHDTWRRWSSVWGIVPRHEGILIVAQIRDLNLIATEVDAFLRTDPPLVNELYRWRPTIGWVRRGPPPTIDPPNLTS